MAENPHTKSGDAQENKRDQKFESAVENFSKKEVPQQQPKKKSKIWLSLVVLLISIGIGVYFVVKMPSEMGGGQKSFADAFSAVSAQGAITTIAILAAILLLDVSKFVIIINATTRTFRPLVSAKVSLWGRYYDNITPSSTGGQPAQIIYLHGKGFSGGLSTAIVFIKYFVNTIVWVIVGGVAMAMNTACLSRVGNASLGVLGWIGWSLNMLLQIAILTFVIMPKLATKLAQGVISLGYRMHIVKNKEKTMQKGLNVVDDFRSSFIIISKRPLHLALLILACAAEMVLSFGLPYFIIKMLNGNLEFTFFEVMGLNAYTAFGASFIPTPGGSGMIEYLLTVAFGNVGDTSMWATFTYRFATFYIYILIGLGITIFNFVRSLVRSRKATKVGGEKIHPVGVGAVHTQKTESNCDGAQNGEASKAQGNAKNDDESAKRIVVDFEESPQNKK